MEQELFEGPITVVISEAEAARACAFLATQPRLGIDTETRPNFRRGGMNPVALLQLSTYERAFLFRLNRIGLTQPLVDLLQNPNVLKVGLSLKDDWGQLHRRASFQPANYVELQEYVREIGILDMSLQKIYANLFRRRISKAQQLTNWEADSLSEAQQRYAATDAWACLRIYDDVTTLKANGKFILKQTNIEATPNDED